MQASIHIKPGRQQTVYRLYSKLVQAQRGFELNHGHNPEGNARSKRRSYYWLSVMERIEKRLEPHFDI